MFAWPVQNQIFSVLLLFEKKLRQTKTSRINLIWSSKITCFKNYCFIFVAKLCQNVYTYLCQILLWIPLWENKITLSLFFRFVNQFKRSLTLVVLFIVWTKYLKYFIMYRNLQIKPYLDLSLKHIFMRRGLWYEK